MLLWAPHAKESVAPSPHFLSSLTIGFPQGVKGSDVGESIGINIVWPAGQILEHNLKRQISHLDQGVCCPVGHTVAIYRPLEDNYIHQN